MKIFGVTLSYTLSLCEIFILLENHSCRRVVLNGESEDDHYVHMHY
jgi:hypothetical protein